MSVERICGSIPTSASSTLLAEDTDMGDDDYDMEGGVWSKRAIENRRKGVRLYILKCWIWSTDGDSDCQTQF